MTLLRSVLIGLALLASPRLAVADATVSQDVPVPGGTAAFARALGIDPVPDRGRFMRELTRLAYDNPEMRHPAVAAFLFSLTQSVRRRLGPPVIPNAGKPDLVPVPLTADVWGEAILGRAVAREDLVTAIVTDRAASLMCHGLAALDDETLAYLATHRSVLSRLAERAAPAFAAFSSHLRIRGNRVVPPGAPLAPQGGVDEATPLWEAVVGEKVTRPERFIAQLFEMHEGRLAYLYEIAGHLDPARRAFVLGLWMPDPLVRLERFKALATSGISAFRDWHVRTLPFNRSSYDAAMTMVRVTVDESGRPAAPAARGFWLRMFAGGDLPEDPARLMRGMDEEPFDAAWVMEAVGSTDVRQRVERLDQIAFSQRVFGRAPLDGDVFVAVRAAGRYRMLALTLERMGVARPAVYVAAVRHAARIGAADGHRGFVAQAQFQGALALLAQMRAVGTLDRATAETLIQELVALSFADGRYSGAVGEWVRDALVPRLQPADTVEDTLIAALAGPSSGEAVPPPPIVWEGHTYRLDLGAAERRRLREVREKQGGASIDVALDLSLAARRMTTETLRPEDMDSLAVRLTRLIASIPERSRPDEEDTLPAGLEAPRESHGTLQKAIEELTRAARAKDAKRAPRIAEPLLALTDELLAQAFLSLAYAIDAGDPDGAILLADDVSRRHDFGFGSKDGDMRLRTTWMTPRQEVAPSTPWHLTGSLLGLDVALATVALRRMNHERVLEAPRLTSNERDAFAVSVSLLNAFSLRNADRDALVAAVARGADRVARIGGSAELDAVAEELSMEGWRRRALRWMLAHEREQIASMFTAIELLALGGGRPSDFDAWGMGMVAPVGCLCSRMIPPGRLTSLLGRPQLGLTAAGIADVNVQVAIRLKELNLPAALARVVLAAAMQDFIDEVRPTDDADWVALVRRARTITREQVEDYVAAATADGPLIPDATRASRR